MGFPERRWLPLVLSLAGLCAVAACSLGDEPDPAMSEMPGPEVPAVPMDSVGVDVSPEGEADLVPPLPGADEGIRARRRMNIDQLNANKTVGLRNDRINIDKSDVGFKVDTDPELVREFLERETDDIKVNFSTYHSTEVVAEGAEGLPPIDLACPSSKYLGPLSLFHNGGSGSSWIDVKPLGVDGSSGGFGWSVF